MVVGVLSFVILIISVLLFYNANQIKLQKDLERQWYKDNLQIEITKLQNNRDSLAKEIILQKQTASQEKEQINKNLFEWKKEQIRQIESYIQEKKQLANQTIQNTSKLTQAAVEKSNQQLEQYTKNFLKEKQKIQNQLDQLKNSLAAGIQARLKQQQKKDKLNFYKLSISEADLSDVKKLENLKATFHKPVVLSKLIWTQYFQKQMTELCDRVFGKNPISGIYKITDLITEQCYIGQSVNIQQRMKQHCKCGLGIEASATNKLYNTMQKDGVWNFTFELLQQCSKDLLNEKEKFWIQMYQSNKFGLNTMKGNN